MDPVQTYCYSENLVSREIEPGASGTVARSSDHYTTEAVIFVTSLYKLKRFPPHSDWCDIFEYGYFTEVRTTIQDRK
jgi:hypothetical protein